MHRYLYHPDTSPLYAGLWSQWGIMFGYSLQRLHGATLGDRQRESKGLLCPPSEYPSEPPEALRESPSGPSDIPAVLGGYGCCRSHGKSLELWLHPLDKIGAGVV